MSSPARSQGRRWLQWLTIGLGVKRWALMALVGLIVAVFGAALAFAYVAVDFSLNVITALDGITGHLFDSVGLGFACLVLGSSGVAVGVSGIYRSISRVYSNETRVDFIDVAMKRRRLDSGERIVALGGGNRFKHDAARSQGLQQQHHGDCHDGRRRRFVGNAARTRTFAAGRFAQLHRGAGRSRAAD